MQQPIFYKTPFIIALFLFFSFSCTNTDEAQKNAQEYIDTHYSALNLSIVCIFSNWNEASSESINEYSFVAIDNNGIEVTGKWNNKSNTLSNLDDSYVDKVRMAKYSEELKQQLSHIIDADIYCKNTNQSKEAILSIELFCFDNIQTSQKDLLIDKVRRTIESFCDSNHIPYYNAILSFTYNGQHRHPKKPYSEWKSQDMNKANWEHYDGYLNLFIVNKPDEKYVSDFRVAGSYFVSNLKNEVWNLLNNKTDKKGNNHCRLFLINQDNLKDIFFLYQDTDKKNNTDSITFITGFYNLSKKKNSDIKRITLPSKVYKNKDLDYLIPQEYKIRN